MIKEDVMCIFQNKRANRGKKSNSVFEYSDDSVLRLARLIVSESDNVNDYPHAYQIVQESSKKNVTCVEKKRQN